MQNHFCAEEGEIDLFSNKLPESKLDKVSQVFDQLNDRNISLEEVANDINVRGMLARLSQYKEKVSEASTAMLWFQYLRMIEIICMFIKAERTANFDLHLDSVWEMLLYFAPSSHHLYARSAHIYLPTMQNLEATNKRVHEQFQNDCHVVWRSQRF